MRAEEGVLSVYINIDPRLAYDRHQHEAKFKSAVKRFEREADEQALRVLEREKERVLKYLQATEPNGRGLAIFSSTPAGIWEAVNLDVMVPTWIAVNSTPYTSLLSRVLDEYPLTAVVMLTGEEGRIYLEQQGRERRAARVTPEVPVPGRHDQGGWAQARYQRHVEFHGQQLLKQISEALQELTRTVPVDRIVLVGTEVAAKEFQSMLPEPLARKVIGRLHADFKQESDEEILARVNELVAEDERAAEMALVQQIAELADAGGRGAIGIPETLQAVFEGRADTLVVADGLIEPGAVCPNCGYFASPTFKRCPACNSEAERLDDVIEHAIEQMYLQSGHVNIVFGPAREELMARGGLGALLRY